MLAKRVVRQQSRNSGDAMSNEAIEAQAIELLVELTVAMNATAKALTRVADMMDAKDEVELWSPENYKHGENDE